MVYQDLHGGTEILNSGIVLKNKKDVKYSMAIKGGNETQYIEIIWKNGSFRSRENLQNQKTADSIERWLDLVNELIVQD